ncbi:glutamate--cysteine ligase [Asaia lannensis]|uniref:Glutamate--cysteine ligase n=1 Tax=Asaia lannensis NBRC 102526 TaxID=1307926 RepID=A0ABT1CFI1_9PROT|nr:glutamate--cysteine ligase [Asaia lannensis]MCO6158968.1 glutamate--cysteine ligase [Asaia lannensis NBRC 102526]GBQ96512.1 glutamate--cysteine ligase [Asaia lannensis NBRC 102526]
MSNPGDLNDTPIESKAQLVAILADGAKPQTAWRIGTEHEKFGFVLPGDRSGREAYSPPAYKPEGIEALLEALKGDGSSWQAIEDKEQLIGLKGQGAHKGESISLEPAGQFELSGKPVATLHETRSEMAAHFEALREPAKALGLGFAPLGFQPLWPRDAMPIMPKSRYAIMRRYMPLVGSMGLDMMTRTCTVQVNLDFGSEEDMARKMRVSLALQPLATALFANSPFYEGKPNGFLSNRANVWTDTDNARSGMPACCFEDDFGFESYVDWVLDVPMYFIMRDGQIHDVAGASFRDWLEGRPQPQLAGFTPTLGDFEDHLTTVFPDVRLKQFLEMRGADAGSPEMMLAQSALWVGLLYDPATLVEAEKLVKEQTWSVYEALRAEVPGKAMDAAFPGGLRNLAKRVVSLAEQGLRARGLGEEIYLAPLMKIADGGQTQAEYWLDRYHGPWKGDVRFIFDEAAV